MYPEPGSRLPRPASQGSWQFLAWGPVDSRRPRSLGQTQGTARRTDSQTPHQLTSYQRSSTAQGQGLGLGLGLVAGTGRSGQPAAIARAAVEVVARSWGRCLSDRTTGFVGKHRPAGRRPVWHKWGPSLQGLPYFADGDSTRGAPVAIGAAGSRQQPPPQQ